MSRDLISKKTRCEFREWLVGWTLRTINELFDNHNVKLGSLDSLPSGERRARVECYYASIDWNKPQDIRRMLDVYEDVLIEIPLTQDEEKQKLIRCLEKDGYRYNNSRIDNQALDSALIETILTIENTEHLHLYIDRINKSIETDPSLAIGSTKELIEATLKTILNGCNAEYDDKKDDIPRLLKNVQKILSNLGAVAIGVAELRNIYGSGHGKGQKLQGLTSRHAQLVVGCGTTLCTFLFETYEHRNPK
jgi:hypothetical protein